MATLSSANSHFVVFLAARSRTHRPVTDARHCHLVAENAVSVYNARCSPYLHEGTVPDYTTLPIPERIREAVHVQGATCLALTANVLDLLPPFPIVLVTTRTNAITVNQIANFTLRPLQRADRMPRYARDRVRAPGLVRRRGSGGPQTCRPLRGRGPAVWAPPICARRYDRRTEVTNRLVQVGVSLAFADEWRDTWPTPRYARSRSTSMRTR